MSMSKYYGTAEIVSVEDIDGYTTPNGHPVVSVELARGDGDTRFVVKRVMPKILIDSFSTDEPITKTELRDKHTDVIVKDVMKIFIEYGITRQDMEFVAKRIFANVEDSFTNAVYKLWDGHDGAWYPGSSDLLGDVSVTGIDYKLHEHERRTTDAK